jgi:hypothetical protein
MGRSKPRAFLLDVGGRQVDGDVRGRDVVAAVLQRRANSFAALAHRRVRQAHGGEVVFRHLDAGNVHFHLDDRGVNAVDRGAQGLEEHASGRSITEKLTGGANSPGLVSILENSGEVA